MAKTLGAIALLCMAAAAALGCSQGASAQGDRVFHVDYQNGSDERSGLVPGEAWKHAPGDPAAKGTPAGVSLEPGDRVVFAAGVRYRGSIDVSSSGTESKPIVFEGASGSTAIIDGSDPVEVTPCTSAAMCGGAENWRDLSLITADELDENTVFFTDAGPLRSAQEPDPASDFYRHEVSDMVEADGEQLQRGRADLPAGLRPYLTQGSALALWVRPNMVVERPITRIEGRTALFDPADLDFYDDRPSKMALVHSIPALDQPGEYVVLPGTQTAVAMLPEGAVNVSAAQGRGGFTLLGASHVTIRNLTFVNMTDSGEIFGGVSIWSNRPGNRGVTIADNQFLNMAMPRGQGPIILRGVDDLTIADNTIRNIVFGSGMRINGPAEGVLIRGNRIHRVGRTAIMIMRIDDALITRNVIDDVRGVHGNGLSAYLNNRNVRFVENSVINAKQPATYRGAGKDQNAPNDLAFVRNVLVGSEGSLGSLMSWGANTRGVRIEGNLLVGGKHGMRLNASDTDVVVEHNVGTEPLFVGGRAQGLIMNGNRWVDRLDQIERMLPETIAPLEQPSEDAREITAIACGSGTAEAGQSLRLGAELAC